jgi:hypothetical protein
MIAPSLLVQDGDDKSRTHNEPRTLLHLSKTLGTDSTHSIHLIDSYGRTCIFLSSSGSSA